MNKKELFKRIFFGKSKISRLWAHFRYQQLYPLDKYNFEEFRNRIELRARSL